MNFDKLIKRRYSCRKYSSDPIDDQDFSKILEAARLAPTAANRQPFQIIVIRTENNQEMLLDIYNREWFVQAPIVLCICSDPQKGWVRDQYDNDSYAIVDAAIVIDHITLQAADLGLGTCWIAAFDPQKTRNYLKLPDHIKPIAFTPLGHPLDKPTKKIRKQLSDLIRYDTW